MSTGSNDYGVTFGIGKNGTLCSPNRANNISAAAVWPKFSIDYVGRPLSDGPVPVIYHVATDDGLVNYSTFQCSITGDIYQRPVMIDHFTAHDSEWVSTFDLDSPPTLVATETAQSSDPPEEGNAGYRAVLWLKDFFKSSQRGACSLVGVPEATFYVWQNNPSSSVRSAGARRALKLRASLEVAIARMGPEAVHRLVSAGSPSIEDRLRSSKGEPWERAVSEIANLGVYDVPAPLPRISSPEEYLQRVREVEERAVSPRRGDGARLMSEGEIRDADQEGW